MPLQTRIYSIDLLRGIVMIIMALDHTRDFFHLTAFTHDPLDLATTTPALFFTRWITHLCAPVFVFLSGTAAWFQSLRKPKKELSLFLFTRGLWLIFVEVLVITLAITFDITYSVYILQVIWAIGISMVFLSALIWLPFSAILAIGLVIVAGHNLLDFAEAREQQPKGTWYNLLHQQGTVSLTQDKQLLIYYPFLPWLGLMIMGYCFGRYYLHDVMNRHRNSILLGIILIVFFIALRWTGLYGDPQMWAQQRTAFYTLLSFIDTEKYPPSLLFMCMTIGPSLVILGLLGDRQNKFTDAISVYGRVPLFYYILHFYLIHLLSLLAFLSRGHHLSEGKEGLFKFVIPGEGYSLGIVYLIWLAIVVALYPLCRWYAQYKRHNRNPLLSYI